MVTVEKVKQRINQSKWTKLYIATALLQVVIIIVLQSIIASQNQAQEANIHTSFINHRPSTLGDGSSSTSATVDIALRRFDRIKWENVAFISFQAWFICMAFDAVVYQNAAEVIALAVLNTICILIGGLEVMDARRWLSRLDQNYNFPIRLVPLRIALYLEIAMTVVQVVFALIFIYLSYAVVKEFGWVIYKKIGPDVVMQRMYRIFQFFVLALKIDVFIEFLVSLFYFIQFAIEDFSRWDGYIILIVTILILPALYFARTTVASEHYGRMVVFIVFQFIVIVSMILMLWRTASTGWWTWIVFVVMGIVFALSSCALGAWTMHNFGKGLKAHVQRGGPEKKEHLPAHELQEQASFTSWRIDDD
ncbi:hypothetical protein RO3G_11563 [Lichtheimia corymbifera JMRC:FSU:9682]|uniref:Uncharacterized protein n=1 Tax=Lichtheimia corymbifera JMRC:FSU:9682 TaxID=1263082 RepID=A0A068RJK6_9FUNG|nr:hypothetical protein RO3G_11563 [Lichtheimia corymbifera JMRC:FSU:9682]